MICSLDHSRNILFHEIDSRLAQLIIEPFEQKELSSKIINQYLFKKLTKQDPLFSQDWKEYIVPELETLFLSCHQQVLEDLESFKQNPSHAHGHKLTIVLDHRDAWLRMLSLIRLLITSPCHMEPKINTQDTLSVTERKTLLQMEIFAFIQQCLVEAEMKDSG
jgi:hypothetical protein